jgi:hypothetical protein
MQLQTINRDDWTVLREQADMLIKSNFLPQSIKAPEQAIAIILQGRELGIGAMAALQTINVIQGKPTVSPQLMLALINRSGQMEDMKMDSNGKAAVCMMKRKGRIPHTVKFGEEEAKALGLFGKDNYKKQPGTMYQWRAVAMCARVVFPDVILGLYTPDEMGADVDLETGDIPAQIETQPLQLATSEDAELDHSINLVYSELVDIREAEREDNQALKSLPDLTGAINYKFKVRDGLAGLSTEQKKELFASLLETRDREENLTKG